MARCHFATAAHLGALPRFVLGLSVPVLGVALLAGCASLPSATAEAPAATAAPSATPPVSAYASAVNPSDWSAVEQAAPQAFGPGSGTVGWYNPLTGTGGTLTALAVPAAGGETCQAFTATMDDWRGVRRYRGEACVDLDGAWHIVAAIPEDSEVL